MPWETAVGESEMAELHPFRSAGGQMLEHPLIFLYNSGVANDYARMFN